MEAYNYKEAVLQDCIEVINEMYLEGRVPSHYEILKSYTSLEEYFTEILGNNDDVTGISSNSYTCSRYQAEENLAHNWDEIQSLDENDIQNSGMDPEIIDCMIRRNIVPKVVSKAIMQSKLPRGYKDQTYAWETI